VHDLAKRGHFVVVLPREQVHTRAAGTSVQHQTITLLSSRGHEDKGNSQRGQQGTRGTHVDTTQTRRGRPVGQREGKGIR